MGRQHFDASATSCDLCAPGTFSKVASQSLVNNMLTIYHVGSFSHCGQGVGNTRCVSCNELGHYFQPTPGQQSCDACPEHSLLYPGSNGSSLHDCRCMEGYPPPPPPPPSLPNPIPAPSARAGLSGFLRWLMFVFAATQPCVPHIIPIWWHHSNGCVGLCPIVLH